MAGTSPPMTATLVSNAYQSRIEHDHAAQRLAGLHVGKALVDLRQLQLGRDPVLKMQLAAHVEFDETRHVDAEMVRAHRRALDAALTQEVEAVQLDLLAERDHADDGSGAAGGEHRKALLRSVLAAEHLEGMLHAAAGELAHLLHDVAARGIDDI